MEKRERKPGYFARLKRRRQLKQSQSEKSAAEQNPVKSPLKSPIISCPDAPNDSDPKEKAAETDLQRITAKLPDDTKKQTKREKRRPPGTVEFIVGPKDTLNSIALKFNITPNKLVQLNKLFSRSIYPGQKLFVPDVSQSEADSESKGSCDPASTNGVSEKGSCNGESHDRSGKPLRRELTPPSEDESPTTVKFLKMSCKYFTDGMGVVGGVMIVTPNNIMFDPHKSDPLVIENGCEEYGLICPMEEVMSVALYDDVSRMNLKDALPSDLPQDLCPVYRPGEWEQLPSEQDLNPFSRYEALDSKRPIVLDDVDSALSNLVRLRLRSAEGEQPDKSPSDEGFTEMEPTVIGSTEDTLVSSKLHGTEDAPISSKLHGTEDAPISSKLHDTEDGPISSKLHGTEGAPISSKLHDTEDALVSSKLHGTEDAPISSKLHDTEDALVSSKLHGTEDGPISSKLHSTEDGPISSKLHSTEDGPISSKLHSTEDGPISSKLHSTEDGPISSKLHSTEDGPISSKLHSTEDAPVSSKLHSATREDQREKALEPCQTEKSDSQEASSDPSPVPELCQTKKKKVEEEDEEEDEGVVQNSSVEEGIELSTSETETQGDEQPTSLEVTEAKAGKPEGTQESVVKEVTVTSPAVDRNRKLSLRGTAEADGTCSAHGPQNGPTEEEGLSEEERRRRNYEAEVKLWLLERMQAPIEDMLHHSEEKSKSPPMFLCFKVGKPMRKSFATGRTSSPAHSFGHRVKQPEYWFAVPQERVDHLYSFFVQWSPDAYGKEAREHGFVVVEKDELDMIDNFFSDPASCSWEIITIDEAKRRQSFGSYEGELSVDGLPILADTSSLLQDTHLEKLACRLPARVQGYPWRLAYSTVEHGTSLKTLYRSLAPVDSPVLMVIKDMENQVFGAFSTHPFRLSEHFYGTGETFLYSFCPEIKVYRWTGENSYFVKGNTDSLQMGGGGGNLGLWLDAGLYRGTTNSCATFNNQPLSTQQDFNIHSLEIWSFE